MGHFGFGDRWIYRNGADGKFYGAGEAAARDLIKNGDLLVNVSSAGWLRDYDFGVKHQMFIDGDPMFCQVSLLEAKKADYAGRVRAHDGSHFTFGLNIGGPGCLALRRRAFAGRKRCSRSRSIAGFSRSRTRRTASPR